jgi:hypothetical protein
MDDGIHLTPAGHRVFAETVLEAIGLALVEVSA